MVPRDRVRVALHQRVVALVDRALLERALEHACRRARSSRPPSPRWCRRRAGARCPAARPRRGSRSRTPIAASPPSTVGPVQPGLGCAATPTGLSTTTMSSSSYRTPGPSTGCGDDRRRPVRLGQGRPPASAPADHRVRLAAPRAPSTATSPASIEVGDGGPGQPEQPRQRRRRAASRRARRAPGSCRTRHARLGSAVRCAHFRGRPRAVEVAAQSARASTSSDRRR